jgi:preprotein translocase subunit Sss1
MRIRPIITLVLVALAYWYNSQYLKISAWNFTGLVLIVLLVVGLIISAFTKVYKKKKGIPQEEHAYALPNSMAKKMKLIDTRTQFEAAILSSFMILIGMIGMTIYLIFFMNFTLTFKILTVFNSLAGMGFMLSNLVTTYQSYVTYMETEKFRAQMMGTGEMMGFDKVPMIGNASIDKKEEPQQNA